MLWQQLQSITDSDTEECFPGDFGTSWNGKFYRLSSEVVCILLEPSRKTTGYRHIPSLSISYMLQLDLLEFQLDPLKI